MMISLNDSWSNSLNNTSNKLLPKDPILWSSHLIRFRTKPAGSEHELQVHFLFVPIFFMFPLHNSLILNHDTDLIVLKMRTSNVIHTFRYINKTWGYNSVKGVSKKDTRKKMSVTWQESKIQTWLLVWIVVEIDSFISWNVSVTEGNNSSRLGRGKETILPDMEWEKKQFFQTWNEKMKDKETEFETHWLHFQGLETWCLNCDHD